ncbi:MAG: 50S ribosomal protein L24 [Chloroflexia bacterium]
MKIRRGDLVLVRAGKDRGKRGRVKRVLPKEERVIVEGINLVKKHRRPRGQMDQGGIVELEAPLHISKVMLICPRCKEPTRVGYALLPEGGKARICKACGQAVD